MRCRSPGTRWIPVAGRALPASAPYETDVLGFSYGFRPGRSQHRALDALYVGLLTKKVNWVLDIDIRGFFEPLTADGLSSVSSIASRTEQGRYCKGGNRAI